MTKIEDNNSEQYWEIIKQLDPELYLIKLSLDETGINTLLIPRIVRAISNLSVGTGWGRVSIYMSQGKVTQVKTEENDKIEDSPMFDK